MVATLRKYEFQIGPKLQEWESWNQPKELEKNLVIPGLNCTLRPFQRVGVASAVAFNNRALIGDEMGLGKTPQAIAWLQLHKKERPAIIMCPASLKEMWAKKIGEWMDGKEKVHILSGRPDKKAKLPKATIYIVNYDILGNKMETKVLANGKKKKTELPFTGWGEYLGGLNPKMVVADESHFLKNKESLRSIGGLRLLKNTPMALPLTGTPIINRPSEFFPILNALRPDVFRNFFNFAKRYCGARHNGFGWDFSGSSNADELHKLLLETCMIRRLKSEVLTELPPKQRAVVPLPMTPSKVKEYKLAEYELAMSQDEDRVTVLTRITALKQAATSAKMDAACEWITNFLDSGEKLVVFAHHHKAVDELKARFGKITKIAEVTGRTVGSKQAQEDMFQSDPECRLFIGSRSAVEGLTLTAASNTAFLEMYDTPGIMGQAEDRTHRIGQDSERVTAWYLVAAGTIEEEIAEIVDRKLTVVKKVLDGSEVQDEELITELLKIAKKRNK